MSVRRGVCTQSALLLTLNPALRRVLVLLPRAVQAATAAGARQGGAVAAPYLHSDAFGGAAQVARSHGLATVFKKAWATAATKAELMLLNWDGDLLAV